MATENQTKQLGFRLPLEEAKQIRIKAATMNMTPTQWIKHLIKEALKN